MTQSLAVLILAAGKGTRLRSAKPKVLHQIANRPMIAHVLAAAAALKPARLVAVVGPGMEDVAKAAAPAKVAVQQDQRGTGDAVNAARLPSVGLLAAASSRRSIRALAAVSVLSGASVVDSNSHHWSARPRRIARARRVRPGNWPLANQSHSDPSRSSATI